MSEQESTNGKHDIITHRIVVGCLGAFVVFTGLNITILQALNREIPAALPALGGTALGALAGMLASIMKNNGR